MTRERSKLLGVCTVFVYQDGYIVQPGSGNDIVDHKDCIVIEDATSMVDYGIDKERESWQKLREAIRDTVTPKAPTDG